MVKEIDLCTYGTPASSVSIRGLAIRLRITHYRKWDHFGNIAWGQQVIRVDEPAITGFDLVHATICRASDCSVGFSDRLSWIFLYRVYRFWLPYRILGRLGC